MKKMQSKTVSIVIPVKNEGEHVKRTIHSILQSKTQYKIEIIVVDDGSIDGCCSFLAANHKDVKMITTNGVGSAMARNIGANHSNGQYLLFCDAHVFIEDYLIDCLLEALISGKADAINPGIADSSDYSRKGFGYSWNKELEPKWGTDIKSFTSTPLLAGGCLAISKNTFFDIGGFESGFRVWGREDEEISLRLWLFGYSCCVTPDTNVIHVFREDTPPFDLNWDDINYNMMRMAYSHFNEFRIDKCKQLIKYSDPMEIVSQVLQSDVLMQRKKYFNRRTYSDDWFMGKFGIDF